MEQGEIVAEVRDVQHAIDERERAREFATSEAHVEAADARAESDQVSERADGDV